MLFEDLLRFCTVSVIWCTTSDSASKNSTTGGTILTPATVPSMFNSLRKNLVSFPGDLAFKTAEFSKETCECFQLEFAAIFDLQSGLRCIETSGKVIRI